LTLGDIFIFLTKFLGIKFLVYEKRLVKEYIASYKIVEFVFSIIGYFLLFYSDLLTKIFSD